MASAQWELGWSREMKRYFFMDKVFGKSSWSRPAGCDLEVPAHPPQDKRPKSPPEPEDLPTGWKAVLDTRVEVNRYYYYHVNNPEIRTWYKPLRNPEEDKVDFKKKVDDLESGFHEEVADFMIAGRHMLENVMGQDFTRSLERLRSEQDDKEKLTEELLQAIFKSNKDLVDGSDMTVLLSQRVPLSGVMEGLASASARCFDRAPMVTFAESSLASAALLFKQQDAKRELCIVNCGGGSLPPEYVFNQETELYCQTPGLMQSLLTPTTTPLFPFGPAACVDGADAYELSTVVYTPGCTIARQNLSEDLALIPEEGRLQVPVLTSGAPMRSHGLSFPDERIKQSISNTLTSVFLTPVLRNPKCTTLILGAWGCGGSFTSDPELVARKLAEILSGKKVVENLRVGWLYSEVHLCFPQYDASLGRVKPREQDAPIDVFRRVFEEFQLKPRQL